MPDEPAPRQSSRPNQALLDEANKAGGWFQAKKTRPIWAKRLDAPQKVRTLEGEEQVQAGHYLCKGEAGDIWPQTEKDLLKRYTATHEVNPDGWRKYTPHPDAHGVLATQIPHAFEVHATWGKLSGKPGDYLLKNFADREIDYPADVWIVDQKLFRQTYEGRGEKRAARGNLNAICTARVLPDVSDLLARRFIPRPSQRSGARPPFSPPCLPRCSSLATLIPDS